MTPAVCVVVLPPADCCCCCNRELAIQLRRDVKPRLDERGIKLFLVSIGTHERSKEFVGVTGFPPEALFAVRKQGWEHRFHFGR